MSANNYINKIKTLFEFFIFKQGFLYDFWAELYARNKYIIYYILIYIKLHIYACLLWTNMV